ncbi:uncharacterized protein V1516DRAFT_498717 [Lipomyces oligophaga]|uniref:uncharacterized protein n=1 Tax=Lipomyces oligophaga TaxID=45792 RepID=UPI0034CE7CA5
MDPWSSSSDAFADSDARPSSTTASMTMPSMPTAIIENEEEASPWGSNGIDDVIPDWSVSTPPDISARQPSSLEGQASASVDPSSITDPSSSGLDSKFEQSRENSVSDPWYTGNGSASPTASDVAADLGSLKFNEKHAAASTPSIGVATDADDIWGASSSAQNMDTMVMPDVLHKNNLITNMERESDDLTEAEKRAERLAAYVTNESDDEESNSEAHNVDEESIQFDADLPNFGGGFGENVAAPSSLPSSRIFDPEGPSINSFGMPGSEDMGFIDPFAAPEPTGPPEAPGYDQISKIFPVQNSSADIDLEHMADFYSGSTAPQAILDVGSARKLFDEFTRKGRQFYIQEPQSATASAPGSPSSTTPSISQSLTGGESLRLKWNRSEIQARVRTITDDWRHSRKLMAAMFDWNQLEKPPIPVKPVGSGTKKPNSGTIHIDPSQKWKAGASQFHEKHTVRNSSGLSFGWQQNSGSDPQVLQPNKLTTPIPPSQSTTNDLTGWGDFTSARVMAQTTTEKNDVPSPIQHKSAANSILQPQILQPVQSSSSAPITVDDEDWDKLFGTSSSTSGESKQASEVPPTIPVSTNGMKSNGPMNKVFIPKQLNNGPSSGVRRESTVLSPTAPPISETRQKEDEIATRILKLVPDLSYLL